MDLRKIKHKLFMNFARFMVNFAPPVSYLAFAGDDSARSLCRHIGREGVKKVLVVTDKQLVKLGVVKRAIAGLKEESVEHVIYQGVTPDPTYRVVFEGKIAYERHGCDGLLAIGGGSSIDAAKVIGVAVTHPKHPQEYVGFGKIKDPIPPLYAIPTTAGTGSEATMGAVISDNQTHQKAIISGAGLLPRAACIDPTLMTGMPKQITAATGMDALTHAVEAYISAWNRGDAREKALTAAKLIFKNLPKACAEGSDLRARDALAHAAYLAGQAINQVNVGNVHAIAHQLGAQFGVPHGVANAMVMPHVLRASMPEVTPLLAELALELGFHTPDDFITTISAVNRKLGLPDKVQGLKEEHFDQITEAALAEADGYAVRHMMTPEQVHRVLKKLM